MPAPTRARRPSTPKPRILPWERILIRTGFNAVRTDTGAFDLSDEMPYNRDFFSKLLQRLDLSDQFDGRMFQPLEEDFDEDLWLGAHDQLHGRAEGPDNEEIGFPTMRLDLLDTYLSGLLRWINAIGITTVISCDGHGERWPWISLRNTNDQKIFESILSILSGDQLIYDRTDLKPLNNQNQNARRSARTSLPAPQSNFRFKLLEYSEIAHEHREALWVAVEGLRQVRTEVSS